MLYCQTTYHEIHVTGKVTALKASGLKFTSTICHCMVVFIVLPIVWYDPLKTVNEVFETETKEILMQTIIYCTFGMC